MSSLKGTEMLIFVSLAPSVPITNFRRFFKVALQALKHYASETHIKHLRERKKKVQGNSFVGTKVLIFVPLAPWTQTSISWRFVKALQKHLEMSQRPFVKYWRRKRNMSSKWKVTKILIFVSLDLRVNISISWRVFKSILKAWGSVTRAIWKGLEKKIKEIMRKT